MFATIVNVVLGAAALLAAGGLFYRNVRQRQTARALNVNTPDRIVEERFVRIGGIDQWIQIRGEDRSNPVLLVMHGGPGSPYATFTLPMRPWEKYFTVVQWDRRGVGKTLGRNGKAGSGEIRFERMVEDGIEVAEFVRQYLGKDQLILMAGSMGNMVGEPLAKRRPDLVSAYVATDLYVNMLCNEAQSHQMALDRLRKAGNTKGAAALEKIGPDPARWDLRAWTVNLGWTFQTSLPTPNPDRTLLMPLILTSPIYSLRDIYHWMAGFEFAKAQLFEEIMAYDARRRGTRFEIPFFLFQGDSDVITLTGLALEYYREVEAPVKGLALIQNAGHFAAFSQPGQFLNELVNRVRPLAVEPDR
jgi:pimeloyl-ACP methyl ester carboxylesterase